MLITANDLPVAGSSAFWGHTRKFRNRLDSNNLLENGFNWQVEQLPYFVKSYEGDVAVFGKSLSAYWFEEDSNGDFDPKFATTKQTFEYNSSTQRHVLTDTDGSTIEFLGNGNFDKYTSKSGEVVEVKSRSGNYPAVVERVTTSGSDTVTEQMVYTYDSSMYDPLLTSVVMQQKVNSGAWTNQHKVSFTYYGYSDSNGVEKSLKSATTASWDDSAWAETGTSLYRYYTSGTSRTLLKYVVNPASYARLDADTSVSDPFTASDTKVAEYADHYFEYDSDKRVTREEVEGGSRTFTFSYTESAFSDDPNHWKTKTVETLPDSSQNIVYSNYLGKTMLHVFKSGSQEWHHFKEYDSDGRVVLEATPAAITGYDDTKADLLDYNSGTSKYAYLKDSDGLIRTYTYHTASGYRSSESIKQGQTGTQIKLNETDFTACPETGFSHVYVVSKGTLYPDDTVQTTKIETTYSYTWHSGTAQVKEKTTTFPVVSTSQNGSGTAATRKDYFDEQGHLIWQQDERGYITRNFYDLATGMPTQQIADADTSLLTNVPSGWSTPVDGGQHLITDFVYDNQGRHLETFGPWHTADVDGTPTLVRRAQWSLYFDTATGREVRTARGYAVEGSGGGYAYTTNNYDYHLINPVSITKTDLKGNVLEQIEAKTSVLTGTADEMFGSEITFTQADYTRWHTYQYTDCCRVLSERVYHEIPTSGEGLKTTNYAETGYRYDSDKKHNATISPGGTITRNVLDDRKNVIETWIGTNDTGATDSDPSGAGATGNNMVIVTSVQYDGGSDGGNNLVTQQTQHVDASTTRVTSFVYDWRNRRVDTNGELDFFQRDDYDNLNRMIKTERYDTSSSGNLVSRQETKYDDRGRTYRTIQHGVDPSTGNPAGGTFERDSYFDENGQLTKQEPYGLAEYVEYTYNSLGQQVTQKNPLNHTITNSYDDASNLISVEDAEENTTTFSFDPIGRQVKVTNPLSDLTSISFDDAGMQSGTTDANNKSTTYSYDDAGRMTTQTDALGKSTSYVHDVEGNQTTVTDPNSNATAYEYDHFQRIIKVTDANSDVMEYTYNRQGDRLTEEDAKNNTTTTAYDALGRKSSVTDRLSNVTTFTYDVLGNLASMTDQESQTTSYEYDNFGRLSQTTWPDHVSGQTPGDANYGITKTEYDSQGRILRSTDQLGDTVTMSYDTAGRLTQRDYRTRVNSPSGTIADSDTFTFNDNGELLTASKGRYNNTVTFSYDSARKLKTESLTINSATYTVSSDYDSVGNLTKLTYPDGSEVIRDYTDRNQLHHIKYDADGAGSGTPVVLETRTYDDGGRPTNIALGNGLSTALSYRVDNLLSSTTVTGATGLNHSYSWDANKNKTAETISSPMSNYGFPTTTYDDENRLTLWERNDGNLDQSWTLDDVGNWNSFTENTSTQNRTHGNAHELTAIDSTSLTYDVKGNLTANANSQTYAWDSDNMLSSATVPSGSVGTVGTHSYEYDALGRRVAKVVTDSGVTTTTLFIQRTNSITYSPFAGQVLAEYEFTTGSPTVSRKFVYGDYIDEPVAMVSINSSSESTYYYHRNQQYSITALSDSSGSVVERYAYGAYGNTTVFSGSGTVISATAYGNPFTYTGRRFDAETGLMYFRARMYDATLGRFMGRDKLFNVKMPSTYTSYMNLKSLDPSGYMECDQVMTEWEITNEPSNFPEYTLRCTLNCECRNGREVTSTFSFRGMMSTFNPVVHTDTTASEYVDREARDLCRSAGNSFMHQDAWEQCDEDNDDGDDGDDGEPPVIPPIWFVPTSTGCAEKTKKLPRKTPKKFPKTLPKKAPPVIVPSFPIFLIPDFLLPHDRTDYPYGAA